jgi:segregation and condensation protein B
MVEPPARNDSSDSGIAPDPGEKGEALLNQEPWQNEAEPAAAPSDEEPTSSELAATSPAVSLTPPEPESPPPTRRILEAMLFVGSQPLTAERACEIVRGLTAEQFHSMIDELNHEYRRQGRPYLIQPQGPGLVLALRSRYRGVRERLYGSPREAILSQAAIEVLSLIAYRQPATRQEIDNLRGHDSAAVLRQLVRRGLIAVVQRGQSGRQEVAYGTTPRFLEFFDLSSLDDMPRTEEW